MNKHINFRDNIISFILIPLIILIGCISFFRFMVFQDYVVSYEGSCDPSINSCFVGCEDDACTKEYFYFKMQKYAPDLYAQCGKDITNCEVANKCMPDDRKCSIVYCDPEINTDECKYLTESEKENNDKENVSEGFINKNNVKVNNI